MRLALQIEEIANAECNPGESMHWHHDAAQSISAARKSLKPSVTSTLLASDLIIGVTSHYFIVHWNHRAILHICSFD